MDNISAPMDENFNLCLLRNPELAGELIKRGVEAKVLIGGFKPTTPIESWHPVWQEIWREHPFVRITGFAHCWIITKKNIIDSTAGQFGESDTVFPLGDSRFDAFAYVLPPYEPKPVTDDRVLYFPERQERIDWGGNPKYSKTYEELMEPGHTKAYYETLGKALVTNLK